eukprot:8098159-Alexandrium_andersonii.AAC.1
MSASLVGSEMCIRDRPSDQPSHQGPLEEGGPGASPTQQEFAGAGVSDPCLLYTSDAADDM